MNTLSLDTFYFLGLQQNLKGLHEDLGIVVHDDILQLFLCKILEDLRISEYPLDIVLLVRFVFHEALLELGLDI